MEYRWYDFVPDQQLFREIDSKPITSIVCQRQLHLYGHVARYPESHTACRLSPKGITKHEEGQENSEITYGSGKSMPLDVGYLVWGLARYHWEWSHRVGVATHTLAYGLHD